MTVINTSYSSIEEAWADSYLSPSLQKKPKKKRQPPQADPICDLYNSRDLAYDDTDIVSYANKFYEKSQYQHPMMEQREMPKTIHIDASEPDEVPVSAPYQEEEMPTRPRERVYYDTKEGYDDEEHYETKSNNMDYFDIILYIISGILLIFMMEQFVRIGMLLSR